MGTVVPRSGAEYAYFMDSFGPLHRFWGKLPAFLCSWVYVLALRPAEVAVITLTFSEYTCQPFFDSLGLAEKGDQQNIKKLFAMVVVGKFLNVDTTK